MYILSLVFFWAITIQLLYSFETIVIACKTEEFNSIQLRKFNDLIVL